MLKRTRIKILLAITIILLASIILSSCNNKTYYISTPSSWENNENWEYQEYDYENKCEIYYGIDGTSVASVYYTDTLITKVAYYLPSDEASLMYLYFINNKWKCEGDECKHKYGTAYFIREEDYYYTILLISKK